MSKPEATLLIDVPIALREGLWHTQAEHVLLKLQADNNQLRGQRDALLEALKMAWPIIEAEKYKQDCSYGRNFVQTKADRARSVYDKACAAIADAEGK